MLAILIVNWNVRDLLRACLVSLRTCAASTHQQHLIVVDNASSDGSVEMLRNEFPDVHCIANPSNRGFTGGNNDGLAWIEKHLRFAIDDLRLVEATSNSQATNVRRQSDYVLLLNPDTEVTAGALDALLAYADANPQVGVVGPQLRYPDGSIQSSRRRFPTLFSAMIESTWLQALLPSRWLDSFYVHDHADDQTSTVDWVMGAAMLVRCTAYAKVGGLDETNFFMYSEELDWCRRIVMAGWHVVYHPAAVIIHHEGQSSQQVSARRMIYFNRSKVRYFAKHHGWASSTLLRAMLMAQFGWQMGLEATKWLLGHRRPLRAERVRAYGSVFWELGIRS